MAVAAGHATAAGAVSPAVLALSDRMLLAMFMTKLKLMVAALVAAAAVAVATATWGLLGSIELPRLSRRPPATQMPRSNRRPTPSRPVRFRRRRPRRWPLGDWR